MKCYEFEPLVEAYVDEDLAPELKSQCDLHLANCSQCQALLQQALTLSEALRALDSAPEAQVSAATEQTIWQNVWDQQAQMQNPQRREGPIKNANFWQGFAAASVLACVGVIAWQTVNEGGVTGTGVQPSVVEGSQAVRRDAATYAQPSAQPKAYKQVAFEVLEPKQVHLMFTSEQAQGIAQFKIKIPDNYQYIGRGDERVVEWSSPLLEGRNLLTLPLVAVKPGLGVLYTEVTIDGSVQEFEVLLHTAAGAEPKV